MIIHLIYSGQLFYQNLRVLRLRHHNYQDMGRFRLSLTIGSSASEQVDCVKDLFRRQYSEAVDLVVNCIRARFDQPSYQIYKNVESPLLNAANGESFDEEFQKVADFYKDDFNSGLLRTQLESLNASFKENKEISRVDMKAIQQIFHDSEKNMK